MVEFGQERREERKEEGKGEEMAIEEVFMPVRTVSSVGDLGIKAHNCRKNLREGENEKADDEGGLHIQRGR